MIANKLRERCQLTEQIFKRRAVVSHEIVNDCSPRLNARGVGLEETRFHHHLKRLTFPRATSVLIAA